MPLWGQFCVEEQVKLSVAFPRMKNKEVKARHITNPDLLKLNWVEEFTGEKKALNESDLLPPQPEDAVVFFNSCITTLVSKITCTNIKSYSGILSCENYNIWVYCTCYLKLGLRSGWWIINVADKVVTNVCMSLQLEVWGEQRPNEDQSTTVFASLAGEETVADFTFTQERLVYSRACSISKIFCLSIYTICIMSICYIKLASNELTQVFVTCVHGLTWKYHYCNLSFFISRVGSSTSTSTPADPVPSQASLSTSWDVLPQTLNVRADDGSPHVFFVVNFSNTQQMLEVTLCSSSP